MKIHQKHIKKRGQFPYYEFKFCKNRAVKYKVYLFDDMTGTFLKKKDGGGDPFYSDEEGGTLSDWINNLDIKIKNLKEEREFLLGVKKLIEK